jgi:ectoine hydroxylase-related dioxygenase (phytanoyl-CoA dioxygenase family)
MKTEITPEQIAFYREQGYLPIPNFFDAVEVAAWRESTENAVNRRLNAVTDGLKTGAVKRSLTDNMKGPLQSLLGKGAIEGGRNFLRGLLGKKVVPVGFNGVLNTNQGDKDSYYAQVYVQCIRLHAEDDAMRRLILDARIGKVAATLAGVDGIRLYHDQALFKPAYGNPTAWHLDNPYWSFNSPSAMTMWIAIEEATMSNGCMWYIPGSHKTATADKNLSIGENFAGLFKLYPEWKKIDAVPVPVPAGSVVFHNGLTAHGAGVNMTSRPRRAFACAFMPEGSIFNGNKDVLPTDYFKSLKVGDVLNNDAMHPLLWSRKTEAAMNAAKPAPEQQLAAVGSSN